MSDLAYTEFSFAAAFPKLHKEYRGFMGNLKFHSTGDRVVLYFGKNDDEPDVPASDAIMTGDGIDWQAWPLEVRDWLHVSSLLEWEKDGLLFSLDYGLRCYASNDRGVTWDLPCTPRNGNVNSHSAIRTSAGRIMYATHHHFGKSEGQDECGITVHASEDNGKSWTASDMIQPAFPMPKVPEGFCEPCIAELPDGRIWMVMRTPYGELWQTISGADGLSWEAPTPTGFTSPISFARIARIPGTDSMVIVWNNCITGSNPIYGQEDSLWYPRAPLCMAVSHDGLRTFSCPIEVCDKTGTYPDVHFNNGRMFVKYLYLPERNLKAPDDHSHDVVVKSYRVRDLTAIKCATTKTIQPYIDRGLIAPWRALTAPPVSPIIVSNFVHTIILKADQSDKSIEAGTIVQLGCLTAHELLVTFECDEPDPDKMVFCTDGEGLDIWQGDNVQVLIHPASKYGEYELGFFQITIDPAGRHVDCRYTAGHGRDREWISGASCKASRTVKGWSVTIKIPLNSMEANPGPHWRANFCRHRAASGELSSWVKTEAAFHNEHRFGQIKIDIDNTVS